MCSKLAIASKLRTLSNMKIQKLHTRLIQVAVPILLSGLHFQLLIELEDH
jgi:hypothetical protein